MAEELKLVQVSKTFTDGIDYEVLRNIDLSTDEGDFVCILGPSGCGKTVLLYLIAGFLKPTSGKIRLKGNIVLDPGTDRVMVFQDYVLFPWRTVFGNVLFGLESSPLEKNQKDELVWQYLELVGLREFSDWYPHKLSGGMKQRVALARALIVNPQILLMDEPFSAIDSQQRRHLRDSLIEIWKKTGKTIVFVTHSIREAVYLSEKIYLLSARPTKVMRKLRIDLPHPRNTKSRAFLDHVGEIESYLSGEFEKALKDQNVGGSLNNLLKRDIF